MENKDPSTVLTGMSADEILRRGNERRALFEKWAAAAASEVRRLEFYLEHSDRESLELRNSRDAADWILGV